MVSRFERSLGDRTLSIETGRLANQAQGAVTVRYGDSVVLATACSGAELENRYDFLPLTIEYEERLYAVGKIPGGFFRREGRPTAEATLVARLTDRPLRPLFPKGFRRETQVIITTLSADHENDLDTLALTGASAALYISDIPFFEPVGAVRLGYIDDKLVINPSPSDLSNSYLDLIVASTEKSIVMIEGQAKQVQEDLILEALELGHKANQQAIALQKEMRQACGKPKMDFKPAHLSEGLAE
ncbi:MAG: polyribonucleotide nucleotidyltransferase, partial [Chloroflexota bacterium]